jgi:hypothetical protein
MVLASKWGLVFMAAAVLGAQSLPDDPVMKARAQRSQAQGIDEGDLQPVPRAILEPPPLPPPEIHAKDLPHPKVATRVRRRAGKGAGAPRAARSAHAGRAAKGAARSAAPAPRRPVGKVAHKPRKRVKA